MPKGLRYLSGAGRNRHGKETPAGPLLLCLPVIKIAGGKGGFEVEGLKTMKLKLLLWLVILLHESCYLFRWMPFYNGQLTKWSIRIDMKYDLGEWDDQDIDLLQ